MQIRLACVNKNAIWILNLNFITHKLSTKNVKLTIENIFLRFTKFSVFVYFLFLTDRNCVFSRFERPVKLWTIAICSFHGKWREAHQHKEVHRTDVKHIGIPEFISLLSYKNLDSEILSSRHSKRKSKRRIVNRSLKAYWTKSCFDS